MSDSKQVDVLHAIDRQLAYIDASDYEGARVEYCELLAARTAFAKLIDAAYRAEVSFNTVGGCYHCNRGRCPMQGKLTMEFTS